MFAVLTRMSVTRFSQMSIVSYQDSWAYVWDNCPVLFPSPKNVRAVFADKLARWSVNRNR